MTPRPRIRKAIKWGGAAVTALVVVVWIGSGWYSASWASTHDFQVHLTQGRLELLIGRAMQFPFSQNFFSLRRDPGSFYWGVHWIRMGKGAPVIVDIPLWLCVIAMFLPTLAIWRVDILVSRHERAARLNLCPKCGYDRAGLAIGAACPECGAMSVTP
jgi:hypothetical protein